MLCIQEEDGPVKAVTDQRRLEAETITSLRGKLEELESYAYQVLSILYSTVQSRSIHQSPRFIKGYLQARLGIRSFAQIK